jgi:glycosyltransferase involved in cell wall biosynthesis
MYRDVPFEAISQSTADDLVARGIPRGNVRINYPGIAFDVYTPDASLRAAVPTFAYLGRLKRYKGVDIVIRAFALVRDQRAVLEIAGSGDHRPALERLVGVPGGDGCGVSGGGPVGGGGGGGGASQPDAAALASALHAAHATLLHVAARVERLHERAGAVRAAHTAALRARGVVAADPFADGGWSGGGWGVGALALPAPVPASVSAPSLLFGGGR